MTPSGPITWNHLQNRCVGVQAIAARMGTVEFAPGEVEIAPNIDEYEVLDFIPFEVVPIASPVIVPEEVLPVEILPEEILPEEILQEEILPQEIVPEEIPPPEESPPTIQLDKIDKNALLACVIVCFLCRR